MPISATTVPAVISYPLGVGPVVTRVVECGSGSDVLVCLHGAGSRADRFRHNLVPIATAGYRVLAVDFPGHGLATKGTGFEYTTPRLADFVMEMLHLLDIRRVTLIGTSLGAHVAAEVACREPELVRRLVLIGAVGLVPVQAEGAPLSPVPLWDASEQGVRTKFAVVVADPSLVTDEWVREESRINSSPGAREALQAVANYLSEGVEKDLVGSRLAATIGHTPALLVWGSEDRWVPPEVGRRVAQQLPTAQLVLIPRTGHAPYYEDPTTFNALVLDFLGRTGGPEGPAVETAAGDASPAGDHPGVRSSP